MNDVERLLSIIHEAPLPFEKTDSQLAQEYRNWFYGVRSGMLKAAEQSVHPTPLQACICGETKLTVLGLCASCGRKRG